ncbi:MAG: hypothetical protein IAE78_20135 [Myxococcus sp.]|nr:hypothetical protein [Myxococcus sp.]
MKPQQRAQVDEGRASSVVVGRDEEVNALGRHVLGAAHLDGEALRRLRRGRGQGGDALHPAARGHHGLFDDGGALLHLSERGRGEVELHHAAAGRGAHGLRRSARVDAAQQRLVVEGEHPGFGEGSPLERAGLELERQLQRGDGGVELRGLGRGRAQRRAEHLEGGRGLPGPGAQHVVREPKPGDVAALGEGEHQPGEPLEEGAPQLGGQRGEQLRRAGAPSGQRNLLGGEAGDERVDQGVVDEGEGVGHADRGVRVSPREVVHQRLAGPPGRVGAQGFDVVPGGEGVGAASQREDEEGAVHVLPGPLQQRPLVRAVAGARGTGPLRSRGGPAADSRTSPTSRRWKNCWAGS